MNTNKPNINVRMEHVTRKEERRKPEAINVKTEPKKLCLFADMIIEVDLTHDEAHKLLEKAKLSKSSKHISYYTTWCAEPTKPGAWMLCGRPLGLAKMYVEHPEDFVIER